jgi:hypothetical protein
MCFPRNFRENNSNCGKTANCSKLPKSEVKYFLKNGFLFSHTACFDLPVRDYRKSQHLIIFSNISRRFQRKCKNEPFRFNPYMEGTLRSRVLRYS